MVLSGAIGNQNTNGRFRGTAVKLCSVQSWRRRVPITIWLPKYNLKYLVNDAIAGVTVGLTSIPQGIAYALVAGLPPQVGLYSSIFPGLVYMIFGSCKDVTVGPTAILAALLRKYVDQSEDFAYLAAFLSGIIIMLLGVMQLGFLLDFISKPVISGFTTAAAMQIAASQLRSLFRISGVSGSTFVSAITNFIKNIKTIGPWDTLLGVTTICLLLLMKRLRASCGVVQHVVRARNALVVFAAALLAYALYIRGHTPFALAGEIEGGLPRFGLPPFSTVVKNQTLDFEGMLAVFGPEGLVMPLVAILESIAIAKAFAGGARVDGAQEMAALGAANALAALAQAMPATGSFTRTALNHASGVCTPAGSFFKASLVLLSVTLLSDAFFFIPRAVLAAIIIIAMTSIVDVALVPKLWNGSKFEFLVYCVTVVTGACWGLEYGILCGAAGDVLRVLAMAARPKLKYDTFKVGHQDCISITPVGALTYPSAQYIAHNVNKRVAFGRLVVVIDAKQLMSIDIGVAESLISVILDLEKKGHIILLWNLSEHHQTLLEDLQPGFSQHFVNGSTIDQHILNLSIVPRSSSA